MMQLKTNDQSRLKCPDTKQLVMVMSCMQCEKCMGLSRGEGIVYCNHPLGKLDAKEIKR